MDPELWPRVEELFHAALEYAPDARRAFLDEACNSDGAVKREVEILLTGEERAGSFLEKSVLDDVALTASLLGRKFGCYRIVSVLGAGGMGEVYRAHDSKLERDVAIKILPGEFAHVPERLARLRREARALASLNHPNIAVIYGLEQLGDADCLLLELVEGETLRGPLPLEKALNYASQVADALHAAHQRGIIHRDLKPDNIKVTPEGRVKVLDFGLAKATSELERQQDASLLQDKGGTLTLTAGAIGTPGYMSPEQARGAAADTRADIWAFGCLLYELLTGKRAFSGANIGETMAAVLEKEPDWNGLPAKTPGKIRGLLRRCLEKQAENRLASIDEARTTLEEAKRERNRWALGGLSAAVPIVIAIGVLVRFQHPNPPPRSEWVQLTRFPDPVSQPAISPDGRMLVFLRSPSTFFGVGQVYVKGLPDGEPRRLTNDSLAKTNPAFSPDGIRIAYTTVDSRFIWDTWVVSASGGVPQPWRRNVSDLVWTSPREMVYSERPRKAIVSAGEDFSGRRDVYVPSSDRGVARRPSPSPDGKWVLLAELSAYGDWEPCRVVPMDGTSRGRQVGPPHAACTSGTWSPDGEWIYITSKAGGRYHIWRQRFLNGQLQQLTSGITEEEGIAMAPDGRSIVTAVSMESSTLWIHDSRGERQISVLEGNAAYAKFTPDGKKVCYLVVREVPSSLTSTYRDLGELWMADLDSGRSEPLVPRFPIHDYDISPDGSHVLMEADDQNGKARLWLAPLKGGSSVLQIPNIEGRQAVFGPDGEIFFRHIEGQSGFAYRVSVDGTGLRKAIEEPILAVTGVSPDGRWIEGWAPLPGSQTPAVQLFPLGGGAPVIVGSNTWLRWSHDGHSLWMQGGPVPDGKSYIIPLATGEVMPRIPLTGFHSEDEVARLPGARRIDVTGAPGPSLAIYAFDRRTIQRNLYRIPIP